jgi:hypothetical protein
MADSTGSARQEAERLVATVLAMAARSGAGRGRDDGLSGTGARIAEGIGALGDTLAGALGHWTGSAGDQRPGGGRDDSGRHDSAQRDAGPYGEGWATGSAECCVCPICRVIASMREPGPETAERLATGVGDLATGVASMLRAFSALSGERPRRTAPARPQPPAPDPAAAWSFATRADQEHGRHEASPATADPWSAATNATPDVGRHEAPTAIATGAGRGGEEHMAQPPAVNHDDPGLVADAGGTSIGPAPAAPAAEDRDAGTGDDARAGTAG